MREKQDLHVFRQQITCAHPPATEEAASPPPRRALGNCAGAMASKMVLHKLLTILSSCCMDAPLHLLPDVPGSPPGARWAAHPTPACFSSRSGEQTAALPLPRRFKRRIFDTFPIAYPFLDAFLPESVSRR